MRRAAKVDANHGEIVAVLRSIGATVQNLHTVGDGCPDILVGFQGKNHLLEIKDGSLPPSGQKLNSDQQTWHLLWGGHAVVVSTIDEALEAITK